MELPPRNNNCIQMRVCDVLFIIVCRGVAVGMPNDDHKLVPIDLLQEKRRILARKKSYACGIKD